MPFKASYLPYKDTHSFSGLVLDYLSGHEQLKTFREFSPDLAGLQQAIGNREQFPVDRKLLVTVLRRQYEGLSLSPALINNLDLLERDNCFTVCTAHQPNLLTGYLYFIYKILHAIRLAEELKERFPDKHFVPVYYMGSEDNDLEELGSFRYNGKKFTWDGAGQQGAVGRMTTASLKPVLEELFREMGPPGEDCESLKEMIRNAYLGYETIGRATQFLVNELFGRYGLVVLDPDEAELKAAFREVMKDDLLNHTAEGIVGKQIGELSQHYKVQAHPRSINLFYLVEGVRERIERTGDNWKVLNTSIEWNRDELLAELATNPERFSPNVILRGLFQETILPDVAFIGGGAELAYWMQLNTLFHHYKVFFPVVLLRQSVLWIPAKEEALSNQLGLTTADIFKKDVELELTQVKQQGSKDWQTDAELKELEELMHRLRRKADAIDHTLKASAEAALAKMRYQVQLLEKKMLRAEKRKMQTSLSRLAKLKTSLFPGGGLQERVENFLDYYLQYGGSAWIDTLKQHLAPLRNEFLIITVETGG